MNNDPVKFMESLYWFVPYRYDRDLPKGLKMEINFPHIYLQLYKNNYFLIRKK